MIQLFGERERLLFLIDFGQFSAIPHHSRAVVKN